MSLYINTVQVVAGFLTPFIILAFLIWLATIISDIFEARKKREERRTEEAYKAPPYDDIMFSQPPNPSMITVRLIKDGAPVWEQSYDKGDFR